MKIREKGQGGARVPMNEKTLSALFDYQCFEEEPSLGEIIDEVGDRYGTELPDDELADVSAAGEAQPARRRHDPEGGNPWDGAK